MQEKSNFIIFKKHMGILSKLEKIKNYKKKKLKNDCIRNLIAWSSRNLKNIHLSKVFEQ